MGAAIGKSLIPAGLSKAATCIMLRIAVGIHGAVNGGFKATGSYSLLPHTITSIIVFALLIIFCQTGFFPFPGVGPLIYQPMFSESFKFHSILMIAHLAVSVIFLLLHFFVVETQEDSNERTSTGKTLQNVFNIISSVVCSIIFFLCFLSHKASIKMESFLSNKTDAKPPTTTTTQTTTNTAAPKNVKVEVKDKAFGKRQRRRNPRRKRY